MRLRRGTKRKMQSVEFIPEQALRGSNAFRVRRIDERLSANDVQFIRSIVNIVGINFRRRSRELQLLP